LFNARKVLEFKGGSLSSTTLMESVLGELFVRKTISLVENREYGFQRWYSQMKRIQRFSLLFPGLFPKVIRFGRDGDLGYFDLTYFPNAVNAQAYVDECRDQYKLQRFFDLLLAQMEKMHRIKFPSCSGGIDLYVFEEVEQKLRDCKSHQAFSAFLEYDYLIFNGETVPSFVRNLDLYMELCKRFYVDQDESYTHGNMTLENILFDPESDRIIFIDPYEENIIDSPLAELSQLLQSVNSRYEVYNARIASIEGNEISLLAPASPGLDMFNEMLGSYIAGNYSADDRIMISLFEVSQFIRMLPFKMNVDPNKMFFFYGLASWLFERLLVENSLKELAQ